MKKPITTLVSAAVLATCTGLASTQASADISGNVAVTSDYVFRGISQANNRPALQGGLDYSHASGFYAGLWSSTVDFAPNTAQEWDLYTGWGGKFSDALSWDANLLYYAYSGGRGVSDLDFFEFTPGLKYDFGGASVGGKVSYADDFLGSGGKAWYTQLNLEVPLGGDVSFSAHAGYQTVDRFAPDHYFDYGLSLGTNLAGLDVTLAATTTDLSKKECASFAGDRDWCGPRAVLTVGKSL